MHWTGGSLPGWGVCLGVGIPACTEAYSSLSRKWVTDRCKYITFPQLSLNWRVVHTVLFLSEYDCIFVMRSTICQGKMSHNIFFIFLKAGMRLITTPSGNLLPYFIKRFFFYTVNQNRKFTHSPPSSPHRNTLSSKQEPSGCCGRNFVTSYCVRPQLIVCLVETVSLGTC